MSPEEPGYSPPDLEERAVIVYVPATYQTGTAAPLVLALHPAHHSASTMADSHPNLIDAAREKGVVLAFPRGRDDPNAGGYVWATFGDGAALADVTYLEGVILWLQHYLPIDAKRTFMSGLSNGAAMTQRFAADRPNRIKAGAAFGYSTGYTGTDGIHVEFPTPQAPISMFLVRGGQDEAVPPDGKTPGNEGKNYDSVAAQLEFWVTAAGGTMDQVVKQELNKEDLNVAIDPHSHEQQGYNYTDVAYLLDSLGVGGSTVIGGHIWDPNFPQFQQWDRFRVAVPGSRYSWARWRGDILMGSGTPNHVNDPLISGVWRPKDRFNYFTDDPAGNIAGIGQYKGDVAGVAELSNLYRSGVVPSQFMLTASIPIKPATIMAANGLRAMEEKSRRW